MMKFLQALKQLVQKEPPRSERAQRRPRRRDPDFVGGSKYKEVAKAPPGARRNSPVTPSSVSRHENA
jgi:hypothetical protein